MGRKRRKVSAMVYVGTIRLGFVAKWQAWIRARICARGRAPLGARWGSGWRGVGVEMAESNEQRAEGAGRAERADIVNAIVVESVVTSRLIAGRALSAHST